jgi:anaerobic magnesium-protoporphyrin IX monomethyl ester cyclase
VTISFETANPELRNRLLRKEIEDEQVIQAVHLLKERGIFVKTLNMIGLPGEDLDGALETLAFNVRLKPQFARCSIATPFPHTRLFDQSVEAGMLASDHSSEEYFEDYFQKTVLDHPDGARLENLHKFFSIVVTFPWLLPVVRWLVRLPPNPLFYRLYLAAFVLYGSSFAGLSGRNIIDLIRFTPAPLPAPRAAKYSWSMLAILQRFSFNFD